MGHGTARSRTRSCCGVDGGSAGEVARNTIRHVDPLLSLWPECSLSWRVNLSRPRCVPPALILLIVGLAIGLPQVGAIEASSPSSRSCYHRCCSQPQYKATMDFRDVAMLAIPLVFLSRLRRIRHELALSLPLPWALRWAVLSPTDAGCCLDRETPGLAPDHHSARRRGLFRRTSLVRSLRCDERAGSAGPTNTPLHRAYFTASPALGIAAADWLGRLARSARECAPSSRNPQRDTVFLHDAHRLDSPSTWRLRASGRRRRWPVPAPSRGCYSASNRRFSQQKLADHDPVLESGLPLTMGLQGLRHRRGDRRFLRWPDLRSFLAVKPSARSSR